uniref:Uncharacterized protein MANES_09G000300 n=1 Tax=Rhizophora mucronata TaxID=61149 RepID=A0A2P2L0M0_RHIMU
MADPVILTEHRPPPDRILNPANPTGDDRNSLPIPPLDPQFFSAQDPFSCNETGYDFASDLGLDFDDNYDFDITFADLENLNFPSTDEPFLLPEDTATLDSGSVQVHNGATDGYSGDFIAGRGNSASPESGSSVISADRGSGVGKYINCPNSEARSCNSGAQCSDPVRILNSSFPASSQGSGNGSLSGSGLSNTMNAASPDADNLAVDQKIIVEELKAKSGVSKRKKENQETSGEIRNQKCRRSENPSESPSNGNSIVSEKEEKLRARLMRNRESAQLSRQRKKHYVEELEEKVRAMHSTIAELNGKISFFMAENASLRQHLGGPPNGMYPPAAPVYPAMAPVAHPWMSCAPYVVKQHVSQVPLVPIPRLKHQQPVPATKAKKVESKKAEGKTKKVASVSFLGLLFFILLFGGLVPIVDVKFGGFRTNSVQQLGFDSERLYNQRGGRILTVDGHSNQSHQGMGVGSGRFDIDSRKQCEKGRKGCSDYHVELGSGKSGSPSNASEPLVASLYVPRNDKLVKIDGNLIIHSILASERAVASHEANETKNTETGLAVPRDLSQALAIPDVGNSRSNYDVGRNGGRYSQSHQGPTKGQKALTSASANTSKDNLKSSAADGKLQQWFYEGLAGPLLSSGTCTEVFQFDTSPGPGAIVPASLVTKSAAERRSNVTYISKGKNRRTLRDLPIPLPGSDLNITGEHMGGYSRNKTLRSNKPVSPMVVSVLVDPREAGDSEVDGMITPKSLSKIFVVVLLDRVKYVTYSCVLPCSGPHLVRT